MIQVYTSSVIDASADTVWSRIRDFNGCRSGIPAIADSRIENGQPADRVGCIRHFHLRDGGMIRERLLALSDYDYSCTYEILESPMGVERLRRHAQADAGHRRRPLLRRMERRVRVRRGRERELAELDRQGVFQGGFDALKRHFGGAEPGRRMLQKIVRSTVIDAPIERVWAVLRDFNSHDRWHGASRRAASRATSAATRSAACAASR